MSEEARKTCFIVGPIGSAGTEIRRAADFLLKGIIRPAIEENLNFVIWRADEDGNPGMITDKVINDIFESDLVIADLTGLNPNVFYELGIRHAASKPTIHVAAEGTKLPFDNLGHRTIFFDTSDWDNIENAKNQLRNQAKIATSDNFEISNPITQALSAKAFRASAKPTEKAIAELMGRVENLEFAKNNPQSRNDARVRISRATDPRFREIHNLLEDVAKSSKLEIEEPYFTEAVERLMSEHGSMYITDLYDSKKINHLERLIRDTYIPF